MLSIPARSDSICALPSEDKLFGTWSGTVRIEVEANGEVYATIANQHRQIVRGVELKEGVLGGLFEADIGAEQANGSSIMELNLRIHETSLDGAIFSIDPLAGVVSHWIRLEQSETTASIDESMSRLPRKIQGSFVDKLCFTCSKTSQYFSPSGAPIRSNRSMLSGLSG